MPRPVKPKAPTVIISPHAHQRWLERAGRKPTKKKALERLLESILFSRMSANGIKAFGLAVELDLVIGAECVINCIMAISAQSVLDVAPIGNVASVKESEIMADEKIIDKIRKVLAMTKSNYREEAEAALLKAQELMAQHGLTMSEVELQLDECKKKEVVDICISEKQRNAWYEKRLSAIIGDNFRCHSYTTLGRGIYFIGMKEDVEIAKEIFLYALRSMLYLAGEYTKKHKDKIRFESQGVKNDYIIGFLNGLRDKFKEQVESKGYALVLVKDALVVKAVEDKKLKRGRTSRIVMAGSTGAREAGYREGRKFDEKRKMLQKT